VLVAEPLVTPDYAVVVDPRTLRVPAAVGEAVRLLVAAQVGPVRLIDNVGVSCAATRDAALVLVHTGEEL
jgi:pantothenate synthetase